LRVLSSAFGAPHGSNGHMSVTVQGRTFDVREVELREYHLVLGGVVIAVLHAHPERVASVAHEAARIITERGVA